MIYSGEGEAMRIRAIGQMRGKHHRVVSSYSVGPFVRAYEVVTLKDGRRKLVNQGLIFAREAQLWRGGSTR